MAGGLSMTTVMISALVSIVTGYIGAMLSAGGVRRQERRVYGLALLAEVKSIHRSLLRYQTRVGAFIATGKSPHLRDTRAALGFWRQDLSVYANNSSRIGLFRARTAVEIIEFYHRIRWLESHLAELDAEDGVESGKLQSWIETQRTAILLTKHHGRYLSRLLRNEVPLTVDEMMRGVRRLRFRRAAVRPKKDFLLRTSTPA